MAEPIHVYEFSDTAFVVGSDPLVCIVRRSDLRSHMTLGQLGHAFRGYASYRQAPWMTQFVGVWGRKNCQRLRRFLRESGAMVVIRRERPPRLRLMLWRTAKARARIRSLTQVKAR